MANIEGLGVFYLGEEFDLENKKRKGNLVLYDSKDLVTHAVCVGMTGSGKTGLCVSLLEEAALDGIPAIVIDPKGDLSNLLLTFPQLRPEDFAPWINEEDARKKGQTPQADLAIAEAHFLEGDIKQAQIFAKRSQRALKEGSPESLRAGDIVNYKITSGQL